MTYVQPGLTLILILLIFALRQRDTKRKNRFVTLALCLLFLWSWPPVSWLLAATLEWPYLPPRLPVADAVDAIVVLGGGSEVYDFPRNEISIGTDTAARLHHAAWLYRNWKALPIVVCGGPIGGYPGAPVPIAHVMALALAAQGVPREVISEESQSRSTYENGLYAARLLKPSGRMRIALVTEAIHMTRSEKVFRRLGFTVHPAPCRFRSKPVSLDWGDFVPSARGVIGNENVLHEWIGLIWYPLSGKF